jgi:glycosyltransferase involved in cell wall biosynthesis
MPADRPQFSIGIPNFDYGSYIGATIDSVLAQHRADVEIHVSDNASTDDSREVVRSYADRGVRLTVNRANVGFAGNLDRAIGPTRGRFALLLSSDDLMLPGALDAYARIVETLGGSASDTVIASAYRTVDSAGAVTGEARAGKYLWTDADVDPQLSEVLGVRVLRVPAPDLLRRALLAMRNPMPFLTTLYPRALYDDLEGYGGSRLFNPDKWFHWRLLGAARSAVFVDAPLFGYRVHARNQTAQQRGQGALKHLVDEYTYTFEVPDSLLAKAGVDRPAFVEAFVKKDVVERGFGLLAEGRSDEALRFARFGAATYPSSVLRSPSWWALRAAASAGPAGVAAARAALRLVGREHRG